MNLPHRSLLAVLLLVATTVACTQEPAPSANALSQQPSLGTAQSNAALTLVGRIPVPHMTGTWDHLTLDAATDRLFASAQEDNQVRVFGLHERKPLYTMSSGFNRPQGLYYIPADNTLAVTNGKDGTLRSFNGKTYAPIKIVPLSLGADMMDMDPKTRYLYVDHGGTDSNRGPGGLAIINTKDWSKVGEIPTELRPAALAMEKGGSRLYLLIPGLAQVGVIDRATNQIYARFQLKAPAQPTALALDEVRHRLFVDMRRPSSFNVLDSDTGKPVATLDTIDGVESMYYDAKLRRIYMTALDGYVQVIQQINADHYKTIARFFTGHHAGTSQWVPNLNLLCVAVPPVDDQAAEIWLFQPKP